MTPLTCLALAIYFEAGGEYRNPPALEAVASVVVNRVEDHRYPDTVCEVVYEKGQFQWTFDGLPDKPHTDVLSQRAWKISQEVAKDVMQNGASSSSTHFHTQDYPLFWAKAYKFDGCIGGNCFYTNETPYK